MDHMQIIDDIAIGIIEPQALRTDREARFPREAIDAMGRAGLLGLVSSERIGGHGGGLEEAAEVIGRIARACPSTAMVVCMHYCATSVIEAQGPDEIRSEIAAGRHL